MNYSIEVIGYVCSNEETPQTKANIEADWKMCFLARISYILLSFIYYSV